MNELKEYLRKRDLKVSGRKEELVARVFGAAEQNLPVFMDTAARVAQTKRERESLLVLHLSVFFPPISSSKRLGKRT